MDKILERFGLDYDQLSREEKEVLYQWLNVLQTKQLTLDHVKTYIHSMKEKVEHDLTTTEHNSKKDIFLKARLRNYLMIESFLTGPERAKQALEESINSITPKG